MKYIGEDGAEILLENFGFRVVKRAFIEGKSKLADALNYVGVPFVMKVAGKNIVHKNKIDGIKLNIKTFSEAEHELIELKKIKGSNGVIIQEKIFGKEFLLGIKKTPEFGHAIVFGAGGINVEEEKDVSFRVCPIEREDAREMIKEIKSSNGLLKKDGIEIENVLLKLSKFVAANPNLHELDINPLMIEGGKAIVVDARMLFD